MDLNEENTYIELLKKAEHQTEEKNGIREVLVDEIEVRMIVPGVIRHTSQPDISLAYYFYGPFISK